MLQEEERLDSQGDALTGLFENMFSFLRDGIYPPHFEKNNRGHLRLQSIPCALVDDILFRRNLNGVLLRCIIGDQTKKLLEEFYNGPSGGHLFARTIAMKIMRVGYYWPSLFSDTHSWVR